jgi:hypothetical protein
MKRIAKYQLSNPSSALRQGEILTNVTQYNAVLNDIDKQNIDNIAVQQISHPYAIVVTQDCDLDWDFSARQRNSSISKQLNSIILCEISTASDIRNISDKGIMNSGAWDLVKKQQHERFYFFEQIPVECELEQIGLPELTADFKKLFGIDSVNLYKQLSLGLAKRRTMLASPYLEHFSRRYHSFHGRVALPSQYESSKGS